jgi:hypothetical protein
MNDTPKLPANRADARKRFGSTDGLRRRMRRVRGVSIPKHLQPWAVHEDNNDESEI